MYVVTVDLKGCIGSWVGVFPGLSLWLSGLCRHRSTHSTIVRWCCTSINDRHRPHLPSNSPGLRPVSSTGHIIDYKWLTRPTHLRTHPLRKRRNRLIETIVVLLDLFKEFGVNYQKLVNTRNWCKLSISLVPLNSISMIYWYYPQL